MNSNPLRWSDPKGLAIPAAVIACMSNPLCAAAAGGAAITTANACKQTWDYLSRNWMNSESAGDGDKDPSTPTGQRGGPIDVKPGTNRPTNIGGRDYTGHALDRMQGRGVPPQR